MWEFVTNLKQNSQINYQVEVDCWFQAALSCAQAMDPGNAIKTVEEPIMLGNGVVASTAYIWENCLGRFLLVSNASSAW